MSGTSPPHDEPGPAPAPELDILLHSRGYLGLLLVAGLVGIPISAIAFGFLAAVHELEHVVWESLPETLGFDGPPAWWPIVALGLAGVLCGLAVTRLPGHGGHVPAAGLTPGATPPRFLPGVVLAAASSLVLGAVIGPEAPLIALGGGLALVAVRVPPHLLTSDRTLSSSGNRTPTVFEPAVISMGSAGWAAPIMVSGPGQNRAAMEAKASDCGKIKRSSWV